MASASYQYSNALQSNGNNSYSASANSSTTGGGDFIISETDQNDGVFRIGESVNFTFKDADGTVYPVGDFVYHGFYENGVVLESGGGYYYFSEEELPPPTDGDFDPETGTFSNPTPFTFTATEDSFAVCFYPGTLIATPDGARAVETLSGGDLVLTADGSTRPLKWMWRQSMTTIFADPLRGLPVTIRAGALGDGMPLRDLNVSPDHALLFDGMLVHAGALVNGTSIVRMTGLPERFTYYHIELDDHALVVAEGVAAETFVDNVTRKRFDNWADYAAHFGDAPALDELDLPRVKSARQLPQAMRRKIAEIAEHVAPQAHAA